MKSNHKYLLIRALFTLSLAMLSVMPLQAMESESEEENRMQESGSIFTSLQHIDLSRNPDITKMDLSRDTDLRDIEFLRFFPNLKELDLSSSFNLGNNYQPIKYLTQLESLNLYHTGLTTAEYLIPLKSLKYLKITFPHIGKAVKHLAQLSNLEELEIWGGIKGLEKLGHLTNLKKLSLSGVFNDYGDEPIGRFPSLDFLSSLTNLRKLDLSSNDYIKYIKPIVKLPKLKNLNLSNNQGICDLYQLKRSKSLVELDLSGISYRSLETFLKHLKYLTKLPQLKKLILDEEKNLTAEEITFPNFPNKVKIIKR